jgi:hypothetical protein
MKDRREKEKRKERRKIMKGEKTSHSINSCYKLPPRVLQEKCMD